MESIQMYSQFDFDGFMRRRGWTTLISILLWTILIIIIVYNKFQFLLKPMNIIFLS